ncbi:MAG: TAXI family TRAP transporter solute-binding subunit [Hyphomicrobiaceae bacterium]
MAEGNKSVRNVAGRAKALADSFAAPTEAWRRLTWRQWLEVAMVVAPALLIVIAAFWLAARFVEPAPPKELVITTGSQTGAYYGFGKRYAEVLARSGIELHVELSKGSGENLARLLDPEQKFDLGLIQGGATNGIATDGLVSLGRLFVEPVWIFYRNDLPLDRLSELSGRHIEIGPVGSGTRKLALELLAANDIDDSNTTFLDDPTGKAVENLRDGTADAVILVAASGAPAVRLLLTTPDVRVMSLTHAEAYTRRFPYLSHIVLPRGAVSLVKDAPPQDIHLVAPMAALVARDTVHPALVELLVDALQEVHSGGGMFNRAGEFPKGEDPELQLSEDAERVYADGKGFLLRHMPFWLANFIERMQIMVLPILTVLIPIVNIVPAVLRWRIQQRLLYWYGQLKSLEDALQQEPAEAHSPVHLAEIDRIERALAAIPIPRAYHEQYYSLRGAADLVRNRIESARA